MVDVIEVSFYDSFYDSYTKALVHSPPVVVVPSFLIFPPILNCCGTIIWHMFQAIGVLCVFIRS